MIRITIDKPQTKRKGIMKNGLIGMGAIAFLFIVVFIGCGAKREIRETKYPNGQLKEQYYVKRDKERNYVKEGLCIFWYENGHKQSECTYKDGIKEGPSTLWYENGQKFSENTYKNGKVEGLFTSWYENGQKCSESTWKDGKKEGLFTSWHLNGKKQWECNCKDGKEVSSTYWDENGVKQWYE